MFYSILFGGMSAKISILEVSLNIDNCQSTADIYLFCVFRNVLIDTITKLLPDKEYLIQVTVKKTKGKVLSYDLLRVRTNVLC